MSEPRTEAGRELLDVLAQPWVRGMVGFESIMVVYLPRVLAIEREAWLQGHDEAVRLQDEYLAALESEQPALNIAPHTCNPTQCPGHREAER